MIATGFLGLTLYLLLAFVYGQEEVALEQRSYSDLGPSLVRQMWTTPVIVTSLIGGSRNAQHTDEYNRVRGHLKPNSVITKSFLDKFSESVMNDFNSFRANRTRVNHYKAMFDLHDDALDSDIYFFYQQASLQERGNVGLPYNSQYCSDMSLYDPIITDIIYSAIETYLKEASIPQRDIDSLPKDRKRLMLWASIHANGSFHDAHHHVGSAISGVLYLKAPSGSGSIFFEDPRGRLPPFGNVMRVKPEVGDLILFPGWLVHGVHATTSTSPRISISFNYEFSWDLTNDINYGYIMD
jgi:hypothetical protein